MTISNELFLAVLAMDAYNRDYNKGILVDGNQVGSATLGQNSSILIGANDERLDQPASFFAQAYTLPDGQTVIAYRGTDDPLTDILYGYGTGAGAVLDTQAVMAINFYKNIVAQAGSNVASSPDEAQRNPGLIRTEDKAPDYAPLIRATKLHPG